MHVLLKDDVALHLSQICFEMATLAAAAHSYAVEQSQYTFHPVIRRQRVVMYTVSAVVRRPRQKPGLAEFSTTLSRAGNLLRKI